MSCQIIFSGAIIRVFGGSQISKDSNAASSNGVDKSFKTHIKELKKRDVPVADRKSVV